MNNGQGLCASCVKEQGGGVFVLLVSASRFLTCAVNSAGKMIGFLVWVSSDSRQNRPWAFLWAPLLEVTPESRREEWDPLLLWVASRHKKRREQSVILQELFSHLRVK